MGWQVSRHVVWPNRKSSTFLATPRPKVSMNMETNRNSINSQIHIYLYTWQQLTTRRSSSWLYSIFIIFPQITIFNQKSLVEWSKTIIFAVDLIAWTGFTLRPTFYSSFGLFRLTIAKVRILPQATKLFLKKVVVICGILTFLCNKWGLLICFITKIKNYERHHYKFKETVRY